MDRNLNFFKCLICRVWSLSARRAWIEIPDLLSLHTGVSVALRKESVDRNVGDLLSGGGVLKSLSARRAWIEIRLQRSIDTISQRRSPQGERG